MTHVFIVNERTFNIHLQYMFAGTGYSTFQPTLNSLLPAKYTHENTFTGMIADISKVRNGDKVLFYYRRNIDQTINKRVNLRADTASVQNAIPACWVHPLTVYMQVYSAHCRIASIPFLIMDICRLPFIFRFRILGRIAYRNDIEGYYIFGQTEQVFQIGNPFLQGVNATPHSSQPQGMSRKQQVLGSCRGIFYPIVAPVCGKSIVHIATYHNGQRCMLGHLHGIEMPGNGFQCLLVLYHHEFPGLPVLGRRSQRTSS